MKRPSAVAKRRNPDAILKLCLASLQILVRYDKHGIAKISHTDKAWLEELFRLFRDAERARITNTKHSGRLPRATKRSARRKFLRELKAAHWTRGLPDTRWPELPTDDLVDFQVIINTLLKSQDAADEPYIGRLRSMLKLIEKKAREEQT